MSQHPLPVIDRTRTEFGFQRTVCACAHCTASCRYIPGYLIPADLDRIVQRLDSGTDLFSWTNQHLLASPGALVAQRGRVFRIPTLVPARRFDGACTFLTAEDRCAIHAIAPFGCAFFDAHMDTVEADMRSTRGLRDIMEAWATGALYAQLWTVLDNAGLRAPSPEACRQQLQQVRRTE